MTRLVSIGTMALALAAASCAGKGPAASANAAPSPTTIAVTSPSTGNSAAIIAPEVADAGQPDEGRVAREPAEMPMARAEPPLEVTAPRHRSKVLDGPARSSKLAPGDYMCRVDAMYKLRPCTVTRDERGFIWLDAPGGLVHLKGVLYDDAAGVVFDGASGDARPFGCFSCQERCAAQPSSCACQELMPDASRECLARPLTVRLSRKGQSYVGTLPYTTYFNHYEGNGDARHVTGWDPHPNAFLVEITPAPRSAPPSR
jgi:hypothetical protein